MSRKRYLICVLFALDAAAGCEYGANKITSRGNMNVCALPTDCATGSSCKNGMCIADGGDPLTLMLQATPVQSTDPSQALTAVLMTSSGNSRFTVKGATDAHTIVLPRSSDMYASAKQDDQWISAKISYTAVPRIPGLPGDVVQGSVNPSTDEFKVQLLSNRDSKIRYEYRMRILPVDDQRFPPFRDTIVASKLKYDVVYPLTDAIERVVSFTGVPDFTGVPKNNRSLVVRAFDSQTGEPVSSVATLDADGPVKLKFAPDATGYRLEVRPAQSTLSDSSATGAPPCDPNAAWYPLFSIDDSQLVFNDTGRAEVKLPTLPQRVRYEGTVKLCDGAQMTAENAGKIPVTLHAKGLRFSDDSPVLGAFDTTTNALYDAASDSLRFCVPVFPGDYEVVAAPPEGSGCGMYAVTRLIRPPEGSETAIGSELELPERANFSGKVTTEGLQPIVGASVVALALGRGDSPDRIELPAGQLTSYNRSRQTTTDASGSFHLALDVGSYDVIIRPPAASGFPWLLGHDVEVGLNSNRQLTFDTTITMSAPVTLGATLTTSQSTMQPVVNALVDAYVMVPDGRGGERAVQIGQATTDEMGNFTVLLPSSIDEIHW